MERRIEWGEDPNDNEAYWAQQARNPTVVRPQTDEERRIERIRILRAVAGDDWGLSGERAAELARLESEQAPIDAARAAAALAAEAARVAAEWSIEATVERRARWNAAVKGGAYTVRGNLQLGRLEQDMGFGFAGLKAAIARHGL